MPFQKGTYHLTYNGANRMRFHSCKKCNKPFSLGEIIWKRFFSNRRGCQIRSYYCNSCYNSFFIDV